MHGAEGLMYGLSHLGMTGQNLTEGEVEINHERCGLLRDAVFVWIISKGSPNGLEGF